MPYRPEPTPPKMTSPSCISHIGTRPPSGREGVVHALTEPLEAAVVAVAHRAELTMPKRASLPSMLPPACNSEACRGPGPSARTAGCRLVRRRARHSRPTNMSVMAARMAPALAHVTHQAAEGETSAAGISRIASSWAKLVSGVGFSSGCAELTLKKPPPLVPSCLMASCDATGPTAMVCWAALVFLHHRLALGVLHGLAVRTFFGCWYS
jgi:hypothetical protein